MLTDKGRSVHIEKLSKFIMCSHYNFLLFKSLYKTLVLLFLVFFLLSTLVSHKYL